MSAIASPTAPVEILIEAQGLGRTHGSRVALADLSFSMPRGQVVGFLGRNGAGKTTTLRILTGTLAPTSGRAWVAGCDVSTEAQFRSRLGYLPENAPVDPEPTVLEHLRFVARVRGIPRARLAAAIDGALERCDLGEVRHRALGALSRGFRQRVGLAQAIIHDPDILILDEPSTGLDPAQVQQMRALVRALGTERTVLFSSHALAEVQAVADRVLILDRGRLVADDTPAALGARLGDGAVRATVRVPLADRPELARASILDALATLPGRAEVNAPTPSDRAESLFEIKYLSASDDRAALATAVVGAGFDLLSLGRDVADLEAVFRALTADGEPAQASEQHGR